MFQHQISKHDIVKAAVAGKLAKKTLSLDKKVFRFYQGISNAWMWKTCINIQDWKKCRSKYY